MADKTEITFLAGDTKDGFAANHANTPLMALFATCIVAQQDAGFGNVVDARQVNCQCCDAPGFNTGWGYWLFECGAERLTDGEIAVRCSKREAA